MFSKPSHVTYCQEKIIGSFANVKAKVTSHSSPGLISRHFPIFVFPNLPKS